MANADFEASNWRLTPRPDEAAQKQWRRRWDQESASLPTHRETRFWLAAGLLLPIWDRLPAENLRVRRLTADTGEALLGRVLDADQVRTVRSAFGLGGALALTGEEAFEAVLGRGTALSLAGGRRLARRRIMGANRIEIEGTTSGDLPRLRRIGCPVEIIAYRTRAFAPNPEVLNRVLQQWPLCA